MKLAVVLVMHESQAHGALKVSKAVVVSIDEVKGQGPLDRTTASAWSSTYQAGPITISTGHTTIGSASFSINDHFSASYYRLDIYEYINVSVARCILLNPMNY